jgi:hypothetical protein
MTKYCSSCRHSKYVFTGGQRKLYCKQREAFGLSPYIPTSCTNAQTCLDFDPENWRTNLNTRSNYSHMMKKCNIPLEEEENGILAQEKLT